MMARSVAFDSLGRWGLRTFRVRMYCLRSRPLRGVGDHAERVQRRRVQCELVAMKMCVRCVVSGCVRGDDFCMATSSPTFCGE